MRIVCLSNLGDIAGYVIRRVVSEFPTALILQVNSVPRNRAWHVRVRSALTGGWLRRLEHSLYYRSYLRRGYARLDELLYGPNGVPKLAPVAQIASTAVNHATTLELLASLQPDVLLVAGAPLLKPGLFSIPRLGAINVHFGIAPRYRGEHTLFWPIYHRDLGNVGVTVHLIDEGIDSGLVLAHGFLDVSESEDEWMLEAKAARMAAELAVEVLRGGRWEPHWQPRRTAGDRVFFYNDRRIWHDAIVHARRRWTSQPLRSATERRVNYCVAPEAGPGDEDKGPTSPPIGRE
jgi:hypothetical protein